MSRSASASARRQPRLPAVLAIIAINFGLLLATSLTGLVPGLLSLQPRLVVEGQVWRLLTYAWIHGGWGHFIGNMMVLAPFAVFLEYRYGRPQFIGLYIASCVLVGAFLTLIGQAAVGASGALCAMAMLAVLELLAGESRSVWVIIPELILGAAVVLLWLLPAMWGDLMGLFQRDGISHWGHLAGFATGFVFFRIMRAGKSRRPSRRTKKRS
jgi:membrane associated rhomboid family serine protease